MALKSVEDQVSPVLFKGIQETQSIESCSVDDIRVAFIKAGVKGEDYDAAMDDSFVVNFLVSQQQKCCCRIFKSMVPAMIIGGEKYKMKMMVLANHPEEYVKTYSDIVNQLLLKNNIGLIFPM